MTRLVGAVLFLAACSAPQDAGALALDSISPASGANDVDVPVRLLGRNFTRPIVSNVNNGKNQVSDVSVSVGVTMLQGARWVDDSTLEGVVPMGLMPGSYDVTLQVGNRSDVLAAGYTVYAPGTMPTPDGGLPADAGISPAYAITGQRWLLPCENSLGNFNCNCQQVILGGITLGGVSTDRWLVTARIRGVMEGMNYVGGTAGPGGWYIGGLPGDTGNNSYSLGISSPSQVFWLNNHAPVSQQSFAFDYTVTFLVDGDATIAFSAAGQDTFQWGNYDANGQPITLPGITTNPQPYDGQFAQIDVLSAVLQ